LDNSAQSVAARRALAPIAAPPCPEQSSRSDANTTNNLALGRKNPAFPPLSAGSAARVVKAVKAAAIGSWMCEPLVPTKALHAAYTPA
jgi:hypothetical protein